MQTSQSSRSDMRAGYTELEGVGLRGDAGANSRDECCLVRRRGPIAEPSTEQHPEPSPHLGLRPGAGEVGQLAIDELEVDSAIALTDGGDQAEAEERQQNVLPVAHPTRRL